MSDHSWSKKRGVIAYEACLKSLNETQELVDDPKWSDGYLAFSNSEMRLGHVSARPLSPLLDDTRGKVANVTGAEGYFMELKLWCGQDGVREELK